MPTTSNNNNNNNNNNTRRSIQQCRHGMQKLKVVRDKKRLVVEQVHGGARYRKEVAYLSAVVDELPVAFANIPTSYVWERTRVTLSAPASTDGRTFARTLQKETCTKLEFTLASQPIAIVQKTFNNISSRMYR